MRYWQRCKKTQGWSSRQEGQSFIAKSCLTEARPRTTNIEKYARVHPSRESTYTTRTQTRAHTQTDRPWSEYCSKHDTCTAPIYLCMSTETSMPMPLPNRTQRSLKIPQLVESQCTRVCCRRACAKRPKYITYVYQNQPSSRCTKNRAALNENLQLRCCWLFVSLSTAHTHSLTPGMINNPAIPYVMTKNLELHDARSRNETRPRGT